ncbi:MAG: LacI family DNA-binding transcriptional regulator [Treponema sp.]|jgi:LacI family transcriptional regulator|nr:LacI family DNA-binding transcriptional regulator [Treponema sp.]
MAPRLKDIAKAADVSPSTVSIAMHYKNGVSKEVRQRILNIAADMGYKNIPQKPFFFSKNNTIRLLKIATHGHIVNDRHNAFISECLEGIETETKSRNLKLEVSFFNHVPMEEIIASQRNAEVGGFIVLGTELSSHDLAYFSDIDKPLVFIDTYFPHSLFDCVDMDNMDGAFQAVQHFYNAGHRNIGLIKSMYKTRNFTMREFGFREVMEYFSLPVDEKNIISLDPTYDGSVQDMGAYLDRTGAPPPTAFFCMSDIISYGIIKALKDHNYNVPEDVSVIGFDDLPSSNFSDPPLTTIKVSTGEMGRRALEKLASRIMGQASQFTENTLISGKLMIRKSVRQL